MTPGHNGPPPGIAAGEVLAFVERVERINAEIAERNEDKAEVFKEAKGQGYDVATLKRVIQRRAKAEAAVVEADELLRVYEDAILRAGLVHTHARD